MLKKEKQQSFEELLHGLEETVNLLESGELSLEESLKVFERGVSLSRLCHSKLKEVEDKLKVLSKEENGEYVLLELDLEGDKK